MKKTCTIWTNIVANHISRMKIILFSLFIVLSCFGLPAKSNGENICQKIFAFRARLPLWSGGHEPLKLSLSLKFEDWLGNNKILATIRPPKEREYFRGVLSIVGTSLEIPVDLRIRGQTSVGELELPKLKLKFKDKQENSNSPFFAIKSIAINTQGFEKPSTQISGIGRLADPIAVVREAAVYEILEAMGVLVRAHRLVDIIYSDTITGRRISGPALFLEDIDALAKRSDGREFKAEEISAESQQTVTDEQFAKINLLQAMIGNWDWYLSRSLLNEKSHNISFVVKNDGKMLPVLEDFDTASIVTGKPRPIPQMTESFFPERSPVFRFIAWQLLTGTRKQVTSETLLNSIQYFLVLQKEVETVVDRLFLDKKSHVIVREHIEAFYDILKSGLLLSTPMTVKSISMFDGPNGRAIGQLAENSPLVIIEERGDWLKVHSGFRVSSDQYQKVTTGWVLKKNVSWHTI